MIDVWGSESGPLETSVGEKGVEKGQGERSANLHPFLVCEAEYRSITGLLPFRNDSRAFIYVRSMMFDMDSKESGPLETFVGVKGVEKGQGERLANLHPFLEGELNIGPKQDSSRFGTTQGPSYRLDPS